MTDLPAGHPESRDPRVYLAAERTLLAWIRTGLAMMGFGFVVARFGLFLRELAAVHPVAAEAAGSVSGEPVGGVSLWTGTALVAIGVLVNVLAAAEHVRFTRRFRSGRPLGVGTGDRLWMGVAVAAMLALLGSGLAVHLALSR